MYTVSHHFPTSTCHTQYARYPTVPIIQYPQVPTIPHASDQCTQPSPTNLNFSTAAPIPLRCHPLRSQPLQEIHGLPAALAASEDTFHNLKSRSSKSITTVKRAQIAHPYARLFAKKDEVKRRKIWNHTLEKHIFNPEELSTIGAPQRRTIYITSLEAHIDRLHAQLLEMGWWPVAFETLDPFKGLNSKTAKSMVAGLQHDASVSKLKLLELERANGDLQKILSEMTDYCK